MRFDSFTAHFLLEYVLQGATPVWKAGCSPQEGCWVQFPSTPPIHAQVAKLVRQRSQKPWTFVSHVGSNPILRTLSCASSRLDRQRPQRGRGPSGLMWVRFLPRSPSCAHQCSKAGDLESKSGWQGSIPWGSATFLNRRRSIIKISDPHLWGMWVQVPLLWPLSCENGLAEDGETGRRSCTIELRTTRSGTNQLWVGAAGQRASLQKKLSSGSTPGLPAISRKMSARCTA